MDQIDGRLRRLEAEMDKSYERDGLLKVELAHLKERIRYFPTRTETLFIAGAIIVAVGSAIAVALRMGWI